MSRNKKAWYCKLQRSHFEKKNQSSFIYARGSTEGLFYRKDYFNLELKASASYKTQPHLRNKNYY